MSLGRPLLAGVELGGTKCICLIGTAPDDIRAQVSIPTGTEAPKTLELIANQLREWQEMHGHFEALGIASFGPVDLDKRSASYGHITSTPKPGWQDVDVVGRLAAAYSVPTQFDTDVNGAALAEGRWGAARGLADFAYITIGTGVGVGLVVNGNLVHGFSHPELGHARVARMPGEQWPGSCVSHGDCVEGLVSGPAIAARTGMAAEHLPPDSAAWDCAAHAIAQLLHTMVVATAPRRIIIGGGVVSSRPELLQNVGVRLLQSLGGYVPLEKLNGPVSRYVVAPGLGTRAGPLGALALAGDAARAACTSASNR